MDIVYAVIALVLLQFFVFSGLVGRARVKYKVAAPAVTGHPVFERYYRVHYNTLEQLVIFIPAILMFGNYISAPIAGGLGAVFILGRFVYLRAYLREPSSRGAGYGLTMLPTVILLFGGGGAALWAAITG